MKKNFNKIPFMLCGKNFQNLISKEVLDIRRIYREMSLSKESAALQKELEAVSERLDGFVYQLFKLSMGEVAVIERYLGVNCESKEAEQ